MTVAKSFCLWLTGLPSSGKTTTAKAVTEKLKELGVTALHLDGDVVRKGLNSDLGLSPEDRYENNRRIIHVSEIAVSAGIPVISSFISPQEKIREYAREVIPNYIEGYVSTPVEICIERDVKGLYAKAKAGEIKGMTGIDAPYDPPQEADMEVDTVDKSLEENVDMIIDYLLNEGYLAE